jgi:hypothetical protein
VVQSGNTSFSRRAAHSIYFIILVITSIDFRYFGGRKHSLRPPPPFPQHHKQKLKSFVKLALYFIYLFPDFVS